MPARHEEIGAGLGESLENQPDSQHKREIDNEDCVID
jgi:hypothetical protein